MPFPDRRLHLAQQLLDLPTGGQPLPEAQKRLATATTDAILRDFTGQIQRTITKRGSGFPVIHPDGSLRWYDREAIRQEMALAERFDDAAMIATLRSFLALLEDLDPAVAILAAIADHRGLRLFRIPTDDPARGVRHLLEEWDQC